MLLLWFIDNCQHSHLFSYQVYNPYLEALPHLSTALVNSYKSYSVESQTAVDDSKLKPQGQVPVLGMPHRGEGHNERYHEELYYEHKVARRRARLLTAAEDAFTMVQRVQPGEKGWLCKTRLRMLLSLSSRLHPDVVGYISNDEIQFHLSPFVLCSRRMTD